MVRKRLWLMLIVLSWVATAPAHAEVMGRASVIDGDTIEIHGQQIRLQGIDAPESSQWCQAAGKRYRCGQAAAQALADAIATQGVRCEELGIDRYQRLLGRCFIGDLNLNGWLVEQGWALAYRRYSLDFVDAEAVARANQKGLWAGTFENPWDYRHQRGPQRHNRSR